MADEQALIEFLVQAHIKLKAKDEKSYDKLYADLERAGLYRKHRNSAGETDTLPQGVTMGLYTGYNSVDVCSFVRNAVLLVLQNNKLKAEVSMIAGEKSAWVVFQA